MKAKQNKFIIIHTSSGKNHSSVNDDCKLLFFKKMEHRIFYNQKLKGLIQIKYLKNICVIELHILNIYELISVVFFNRT